MSTNVSVFPNPSHTCTLLTRDEENRILCLDSEIRSAMSLRDETKDPTMLPYAVSVLNALRKERLETQRSIQETRRPTCPACSTAQQSIRLSVKVPRDAAPGTSKASTVGPKQNPYVNEGWWEEFGLPASESK